MENFDFILILLACVIGSTVISRLVRTVSLPLLQIIIGAIVALCLPGVIDVHIDSELFMVLFIAPLLFNEARNTDIRDLWEHKGAIFSLAVVLVVITAAAVGFALKSLVPTMGLAAAFACGAALGPTDASAVAALSSKVKLKPRQDILLSGESLINDASGVVVFHFAMLAAVTGAFSPMEAGESFLILFFGGLALGAAVGGLGELSTRILRRLGVEDTTVYTIYEVFTPFFVFFLAEWVGVSGVLAVVAAGIVMADRTKSLVSPTMAKHRLVSNGFWTIFVFLINSIIFIMLGMQLPQAIQPALAENFSLGFLLMTVAALTGIVMGCRFLWLITTELIHKDHDSGLRGWKHPLEALRHAAVLTFAGPKGAVTLSIIFTIPLEVNGAAFPYRDLIIFLTASVILCTLLIAEFILPLVAAKPEAQTGPTPEKLANATMEVLGRTIRELQSMLNSGTDPEYDPAIRATIGRYQTRLDREKATVTSCCMNTRNEITQELQRRQQRHADELQSRFNAHYSRRDLLQTYNYLRIIRRSLGYDGPGIKVGSRFRSLPLRLALQWERIHPERLDTEHSQRLYYETCMFAIELEYDALDYLSGLQEHGEPGTPQYRAAELLFDEHKQILDALWDTVNFGQDVRRYERPDMGSVVNDGLPEGVELLFTEQFETLNRHMNEVQENALSIELDVIRHMQDDDEIGESTASELRQRVYAMQMLLAG